MVWPQHLHAITLDPARPHEKMTCGNAVRGVEHTHTRVCAHCRAPAEVNTRIRARKHQRARSSKYQETRQNSYWTRGEGLTDCRGSPKPDRKQHAPCPSRDHKHRAQDDKAHKHADLNDEVNPAPNPTKYYSFIFENAAWLARRVIYYWPWPRRGAGSSHSHDQGSRP